MKKIAKFIQILIISCTLFACTAKQKEKVNQLVLINYYQNDEIHEVDSLILIKTLKNDTLSYYYKLGNKTHVYSFLKPVKNDSFIYLYGQECPLIATRTFRLDNEEFTIQKYFYDVEESSDEESSLFYNKDYGFLVGFNDGWLDLIFSMVYDEKSRKLGDSILNDRTGFFLKNIPKPIRPKDKLDFVLQEDD